MHVGVFMKQLLPPVVYDVLLFVHVKSYKTHLLEIHISYLTACLVPNHIIITCKHLLYTLLRCKQLPETVSIMDKSFFTESFNYASFPMAMYVHFVYLFPIFSRFSGIIFVDSLLCVTGTYIMENNTKLFVVCIWCIFLYFVPPDKPPDKSPDFLLCVSSVHFFGKPPKDFPEEYSKDFYT